MPQDDALTTSSQVPSQFDHDFRRLVLPALRRRARRLASGVNAGRWSYSEAWHSLLREALRRGAIHLSDFDGLEEFREHLGGKLTITLLKDIGRAVEVHEMSPKKIVAAIHELRERTK